MLCPNFRVPLSVLCEDKIYLSGYSYYYIRDEGVKPPLTITTEQNALLVNLRWALCNGDQSRLNLILDEYPTLPQLLFNSRGRCDQDAHEVLFGLLLTGRRIADLYRLYRVYVADDSCDSISIAQEENFGHRCQLIHDRLLAARQDLDYKGQVRGLPVETLVGKGSYGYVFTNQNSRLFKYNTTSAEYIREVLAHCILHLMSTDLPAEVISPCSLTPDMIQHHVVELYPLTPIRRSLIHEYISKDLSPIDGLAVLVRNLFLGIRALRDRFIMHLDLSTTNVMWDTENKKIRVIDYGGTIGDDSFLNIGQMVECVCTLSTRPPEYRSSHDLWRRNESSEALSAYYSIMSYIFDPKLINHQPQVKEAQCHERVVNDLEAWDITGVALDTPSLRRVHEAARNQPRDRPSLDWLCSNGSSSEDRHAIEMGWIGSIERYTHIRSCIARYISLWPIGLKEPLSVEWQDKRTKFISIILSRIITPAESTGVSCGGMTKKIIPPPYTLTRCISLYDALRDIVLSQEVVEELTVFMTDTVHYVVLATAILYVSLASSKATLIDIEHHANHPLHVVMRAISMYPHLSTLFLSPITAHILLVLDIPKMNPNDQASITGRRMEIPILRPETSHRIIRCLYNLRRDSRNQPMQSRSLGRIVEYIRRYMSRLLMEPIVTDDWWSLLFEMPESPDIPVEYRTYIDSVIAFWFSSE